MATTDVLFAISDTGGGHRSAALGISAALDEVGGGKVTSRLEDILRLTDFPGVSDAPDLYDQLSTRWLRLYDIGFELTNQVRTVDVLSRLVYVHARRNIVDLLSKLRPKVVVVTHPLVHRLVVAARRSRRIPCRVVTVVTDLVSLHASWTYSGVDLALVPTVEAYRLMIRRGMSPLRLHRTGFPVHPKFADYSVSRHETREQLGLARDPFTILMTSGGVGSGRMHELVPALEKAYPQHQLLVVTGKNQALGDELRQRVRNPHTQIYGFVNNMEALMAASDVVVTKAGPGTLMEALVMRKPALLTEAVGIQEQGNIDFVLNYELGAFCPTNERIIEAVAELMDEARYKATVARLEGAVPRDGARQIARITLEQMELAEKGQPPEHLRPLPRSPLRRLRYLAGRSRWRWMR
jgi:UDP-N-acetylglucosamine:LPS N-acetylglucosamine transferase